VAGGAVVSAGLLVVASAAFEEGAEVELGAPGAVGPAAVGAAVVVVELSP
jgi:hypothetical protein